MKLPQWMEAKVKSAVAGSRLTLRGEWIVQNREPGVPMALTGDPVDALGLTDVLAHLRARVPGLRIDVAPGICDVTIRLFAYEASVAPVALADGRASFYEALRQTFAEAAACVQAAGFGLRLDVVGELTTRGTQESFRFLNKGTEVAWKATEEKKPAGAADMLRRAVDARLHPGEKETKV